MVLGKLLVPGRPTNLDYRRARVYCTCSRCGWMLFGHFYSHRSFLSSFSLSLRDGSIKTKILTQRAVNPKQPTNQPTVFITVGQGPTALAVGAGRGCLDIFTLIYFFSPLSPPLWETARSDIDLNTVSKGR